MKYFELNEFNCSCCDKNGMSPSFLSALDKARGYAKTPFMVTSGYRCKKHNKEEGGSKGSSHLRGMAADILAEHSVQRYKIIEGLIKAKLNRIGIGKGFIHVDNDPAKTPCVMWVY